MIDTDKYEGHTKGPWDELLSAGVEDQKGWDTLLELGFNDEARLLIADAPLLLAEVKRLREGIQDALYLFQEAGNPKMSDKKRLETICDALLEVIE